MERFKAKLKIEFGHIGDGWKEADIQPFVTDSTLKYRGTVGLADRSGTQFIVQTYLYNSKRDRWDFLGWIYRRKSRRIEGGHVWSSRVDGPNHVDVRIESRSYDVLVDLLLDLRGTE